MSGTVAVVTGATGGMGQVIARELVHAGAHVIAIGRNRRLLEKLRLESDSISGDGSIAIVEADLSTRDGIRFASAAVLAHHDGVNLLVNNAGAHFPDRRLSRDGLELHIAVNYFAAFGLTELLRDALVLGRARVVNVASDTLRDTRKVKLATRPRPVSLDIAQLDDLRLLNPARGFDPFHAYARAKLLTVMSGFETARSLAPNGVTVNSVHPGIVSTEIINDLIPTALRPFAGLIRRSMLSPAQGAASALRLGTSADLNGVTGKYFVRQIETPTPEIADDLAAQSQLRKASRRLLDGSPSGA